jgi:hypothetical protein
VWAVQPIAKSDRNVTRLRSAALVTVVQPANLRNRDHAASRWRHDRTGNGCILVQAEVRGAHVLARDSRYSLANSASYVLNVTMPVTEPRWLPAMAPHSENL